MRSKLEVASNSGNIREEDLGRKVALKIIALVALPVGPGGGPVGGRGPGAGPAVGLASDSADWEQTIVLYS